MTLIERREELTARQDRWPIRFRAL